MCTHTHQMGYYTCMCSHTIALTLKVCSKVLHLNYLHIGSPTLSDNLTTLSKRSLIMVVGVEHIPTFLATNTPQIARNGISSQKRIILNIFNIEISQLRNYCSTKIFVKMLPLHFAILSWTQKWDWIFWWMNNHKVFDICPNAHFA